MPAEITAALTNIHDDCAAFKEAFPDPDLDLDRLEDTQVRIVAAFREDLGDRFVHQGPGGHRRPERDLPGDGPDRRPGHLHFPAPR